MLEICLLILNLVLVSVMIAQSTFALILHMILIAGRKLQLKSSLTLVLITVLDMKKLAGSRNWEARICDMDRRD